MNSHDFQTYQTISGIRLQRVPRKADTNLVLLQVKMIPQGWQMSITQLYVDTIHTVSRKENKEKAKEEVGF